MARMMSNALPLNLSKIHNQRCWCCNDGFWKTNKKNRKKIRKQNRKIEERMWRKDSGL